MPVERRRARADAAAVALPVAPVRRDQRQTVLLFYGALAAAGYLVVLQCQLQLGYTPTQAGAALIPASVVFLVALAVQRRPGAPRRDPRRLMVAGILAVAVGFLWLSTAAAGPGYVQAILPGALLWGLGIGLAVTPLTAAVLAAVGDADLGEASAINDAASRVGGVVAIAPSRRWSARPAGLSLARRSRRVPARDDRRCGVCVRRPPSPGCSSPTTRVAAALPPPPLQLHAAALQPTAEEP